MPNQHAEQLRDLLRVARIFREYAASTDDEHYMRRFLETADVLEMKARRLANGAPMSKHINLVC
jgi:hypothetical protein